MFAAEQVSTIIALKGKNNIVATVFTLRRLFQLPEGF
jgi:hypothetical protein